jgi:hypothetical protein
MEAKSMFLSGQVSVFFIKARVFLSVLHIYTSSSQMKEANGTDPPGRCHMRTAGGGGTPVCLMKLSISRPDNVVVP